jgi:hypothetical protein
VLLLSADDNVNLPTTRRKGPKVALHTEEQKLGHVAEVEADAPSIGTTIFANLVPYDVGFVTESPGLHNMKGL